jgi:hypothetical protein
VAEARPVLGGHFASVGQAKQVFAGLGAGDLEVMRSEGDVLFGSDRIDG